MNLVSTMVGLSVMATAAPAVLEMSTAPIVAQKRADNLTAAEARAVTYAGKAEATGELPSIPNGCAVSDPEDSVYTVTCTQGSGQFSSAISRSFRIISEIEDGGSGGRTFMYPTPAQHSGHQCPTYDSFGVSGYNDDWSNMRACIPTVAWTKPAYLASNPDFWLYDLQNWNGWGNHPDY